MRHHRLAAPAVVAVLLLGACGDDDDSGDSGSASTSSAAEQTTSAAPQTTDRPAPSSTARSGGSSSSAPSSSTGSSTAPSAATALLLTVSDLPGGWKSEPSDTDSDSDSGFTAPECAALAALDDDPALQDDDEVALLSPDQLTLVRENVTVGDAAAMKRAYDVFAADTTVPCLTAEFQRPGLFGDGVAVENLAFTRQDLAGGEQAVGYAATGTLKASNGVTAPLSMRLDAVRAANALSVLITVSEPGAQPVDSAAIVTAAGNKLGGARA